MKTFSLNSIYFSLKPRKIFVANFKDDKVRLGSSSGGAFYAIATTVLSHGGIVVGAAYQGTEVQHLAIDTASDLWKLQKSKYAPSSLRNINMESLLSTGKTVLFTGTPCQVKGISQMYGNSSNLLLLEIACHGVPNKKDYDDYIQKNDIIKIDFRCKKLGWKNNCIEYTKSDGTIVCEPAANNTYYQKFLSGEIIRKSCFSCTSKYFTSGADFSLADAWGINDIASQLDDNKGSSVIVLHTKKAIKTWEEIKEKFNYKKTSLLNVIRFNPNIVRPTHSDILFIEAMDPYIGLVNAFLKRFRIKP